MRTRKFFTKKIVVIAALTLAVVSASIGTTVAYLKDSSSKVVNTFEVGSIETEILEVASETTKMPYVMNVGKNDCYIRMRATVSPTSAGNLADLVKGLDTTNWVYNAADGFYYYQKKVSPNQITATPLFREIDESKVTADSKFDIVLYQEAVQTEIYVGTSKIVDMMTIWQNYDNK